ncbi:cache domain-containing sensor histidine kinase [Cohnella abietis]|uniref:Sensor histidine kinase n=1 Tax=Cohnella abietis TaxID=2507935 RepID=A0A3T1D604_9BACL|nr:sensor histidine kinase [Cohnella abietis]BBI33498.1 sensor histidine kinase [Cohnella abietis]
MSNWRNGITSLFSSWKLLLFILISLLMLFLISFQGYIISKQSTKKIEDQYYRTIVENMDSISVNLSNYLNYMDDFARALSNNPDLIQILQTKDEGDRRNKVEEQLQSFSEYYHLRLPVNIQVFDSGENVFAYPAINDAEGSRLVNTISGFPWFSHRIALDNNFLHWNVTSDFHDSSSSNVLYVSKNIIWNNESLGLLVIELNGAQIERMLTRVQINRANPIFIFSGDMQTLFHNEEIPQIIDKSDDSIRSVYKKVKDQNRDEGEADIRLAVGDYRLVYKRIAATPWTMVSLIPPYLLHADSVSIWRMTAVMAGISFLFIIVFFAILHAKVTTPVQRLSRIISESGNGAMSSDSYSYQGFKEIETLNVGIHQFLGKIQEQVQTIKHGESEKRQLELRVLQEQMRPHFWHNSLNSLRFLAVLHGDPTMAEAILSLTRMLDYTLRNTHVLYSTLEDEKDYAMSFIKFQEIRSMQKIRVELDMDKYSLSAHVPKFTIQPLVENAIVHGFASPSERESLIQIKSRIIGSDLVITITDNGKGIDPSEVPKLFEIGPRRSRSTPGGLSLVNLRQRFRLEYGEPYGVEIDGCLGEFTKVTVTIPYSTTEQQGEEGIIS